uniref:histidinol dehydrogenase n=1 Tax=Winogradskyella poriferorum TaxID=307627 RepID=UPI003D650E69
GSYSQVILVTTRKIFAEDDNTEDKSQLEVLPRKAMPSDAINNSKSIVVDNNEIVLALIVAYGPEHFNVA